MDSLETIIKNPDSIDLYSVFSLRNNITESPLLKDRTTSQRNRALIAVVTLKILYYAQSKRFNIVQRVNIQFAFINNVLKSFVESFHQMGFFILYKSFYCGL